MLELRLLKPLHSLNPGLFENFRLGLGLDGARPPRDPGAEALGGAEDDDEGLPARSSTPLAPSTPYKTKVSNATWMYLNAQVMTTTSSLARRSPIDRSEAESWKAVTV